MLSYLPKLNIAHVEKELLSNGMLNVVKNSVYDLFSADEIKLFAHKHGIYCLPTVELAEWLLNNFDLTKAIEIGAGHGALSRYLGISATDSKMTDRPEIKFFYEKVLKQPTIKYPKDIIGLNAIEAVKKYKPEIVIGCWVTHLYKEEEPEREGNALGIDEEWLLDHVKKYIVVGNTTVHSKKKILERPHKEYKFPWLRSRSKYPEKNIIYVWE